jgi:putative oxidoreductase
MLDVYDERSSARPYGLALLRLAIGTVFSVHGAQKLFGAWGGGGLPGTQAYFSQLGLEPAYALAVAAGVVEFGGGLLLVLGAFTALTSALLAVEMVVAVWQVHLANGFFVSANGYEYNLTLIAALLCLMLSGPGALSVDARRASHAATAAAGRARVRFGKV